MTDVAAKICKVWKALIFAIKYNTNGSMWYYVSKALRQRAGTGSNFIP